MAEDIKSSKDSKDRLSVEGDIVDIMRDQLDLQKQLKNAYNDISKLLQNKKSTAEQLRKSIEQQEAAIRDNGIQIKMLAEEEKKFILEKNKYLADAHAVEENLIKTKMTQLRVDGDLAKNAQERVTLEVASVENINKSIDLSNRLVEINKNIAYAEENGLDTGEAYNTLLESRKGFLELEKKNKIEGMLLNKNILKNISSAKELSDEKIKLDERETKQLEHISKLNQSANAANKMATNLKRQQVALEADSAERLEDVIKKRKDEKKIVQEIANMVKNLQAKLVLANLIYQAYDRFVKLDQAAENFRKTTGFSSDQMRDLRSNAESTNRQFQDMGVSIEKVYDSAKALVDVFGRTTLITKEALENVSLLSANLGVAEADSANVLANFQGLGGATEKAAMNVIKVGAGISEKAGVPFKMVMNDIANASSETLNLVGATPSKLMKATIAARALGTDINKIAATQQKLLNYSSSITSELEASALLGKSISFQKARQLAYDGDAVGAAKATLDTIKKAGDFNKMTVYQKKAIAEASGMELKDITKMMAVEKQRDAILLNGTEEQKKKLLDQEAELENLKKIADLDNEDLARQNEKAIRQQKIQGLVSNMQNTIESVVIALQDIFEPIVRVAAGILVPLLKIIAAFVRGLLSPLHNIGKALMGNAEGAKKVGVAFDAIGKFMVKVYEGAEKFGEIVGNILWPAMQIYGVFRSIIGPINAIERITRTTAAFFLNISRTVTFFSRGLTGIFAVFRPIANAVAMVAKGLSFVAKFAGPIGLVITAIQAVVDYIGQMVDIWTSEDMSIGDKILSSLAAIPKALYNVMVKPFIDAIDWVLEYFGINFSVGEFFKEWVSDMMNLGTMMIQPIVNSMYELWESVTDIFDGKDIGMNIVKGLWSVGKLILQVLYWPFTAAWGLISGWLGQSPSELGEGILNGIKSVAGFVLDALTFPFRTAMNFISSLFGGDGQLGTTIIDGIKNIASFIFDILTTPFKKAIDFVKGLPLVGKLFGGADDISKQASPASSAQSVQASNVVEVAHLDELRDVVMELTNAVANLGTAVTTAPVTGAKLDTSGLEAKLDNLTQLLVGGAVRVYLDGKDVSSAMSSTGR